MTKKAKNLEISEIFCTFAPIFIVYMRTYCVHNAMRAGVLSFLMLFFDVVAMAQAPAGTTADQASRIKDYTTLKVQSGSNFIRVDTVFLPATVIYLPDTAFGPVPTAKIQNETVEAEVFFDNCQMGWKWVIESSEVAKIMEINAHEDALIKVEPTLRYNYNRVSYSGCDSVVVDNQKYTKTGEYVIDTIVLVSGERQINILVMDISYSSKYEQSIDEYEPFISATGKVYDESGDYRDTIANAAGCDSVILTHLTLYPTSSKTIEIDTCDSYTLDGVTYTSSVSRLDTIVAADHSRVIRTLNLTIRHSTSSVINITQRLPYTSDQGNTYEESGVYTETITNAVGCDSVITLNITILGDITYYDTVYYCPGYNTRHEERIDEEHVRRYMPYTFVSPATFWDAAVARYVKSREKDRTLVDLHEAQIELAMFYSGGKTPIESIVWNLRKDGEREYEQIVVENGPQWIVAGKVVVQIRFLCGEIYNNEILTDIENIDAEVNTPVKRIVNGQLVIIRGGEQYTVTGQKL